MRSVACIQFSGSSQPATKENAPFSHSQNRKFFSDRRNGETPDFIGGFLGNIFFIAHRWRREGDSNPRTGLTVTRFPIVRLRPAQPPLRTRYLKRLIIIHNYPYSVKRKRKTFCFLSFSVLQTKTQPYMSRSAYCGTRQNPLNAARFPA